MLERATTRSLSSASWNKSGMILMMLIFRYYSGRKLFIYVYLHTHTHIYMCTQSRIGTLRWDPGPHSWGEWNLRKQHQESLTNQHNRVCRDSYLNIQLRTNKTERTRERNKAVLQTRRFQPTCFLYFCP